MRVPFKYHIPLLKTNTYQWFFVFEKRFSINENFVSLGCACHPAHMLDSMKFRKQSLPFDWLLTDAVLGMNYVCENISNEFKYFATDLKKNERDKVYSAHYPYSCFFHHSGILTDEKMLETFNKRCTQFLKTIKNQPCVFLYSTTSSSLNSNEAVTKLTQSIIEFMNLIKPTDKLLIYINCEESIEENKDYCDKFILELKKINRVSCTRFLLEVKKYGLWGYENNYSLLFNELGIKIKNKFPKIGFKKNRLQIYPIIRNDMRR